MVKTAMTRGTMHVHGVWNISTMWTHYMPTQGTSIILNALFVLTFLPQLKNWRNTSKKNMVDSNLVSKKYKPRDVVKRGWNEKNERRKKWKQRPNELRTSHARSVWKDSARREGWTSTQQTNTSSSVVSA